jgi:1-phosphatidylinositol phosphodiesterase
VVVKGNPPWSEGNGWGDPKYYSTIQAADVDGDDQVELLARAAAGMEVWRFNAALMDWEQVATGGPFPVAGRSGNYGGYAWQSGPVSSYPDWMAGIPDDRRISELSIPGTHDTMAIHGGPLPYMAETQQMFLENQLHSGIRALDIRLQCDGSLLLLFHGLVPQWADFDDVLDKVVQFLNEHPTETVLMAIAENNKCFWCLPCSDSFVDRIDSYLSRLYWEDGVPIGPYWDWVWDPTSSPSWSDGSGGDNPTLGEVRGKIVIMDAFSGAETCGPTVYGFKYADTCQFKQDEYKLYSWHDLRYEKWPAVEAQLDAADAGDLDKLYVNYLSGTEGSGFDLDPVVPYFVASGHNSGVLDYQYQTDGRHRWTGKTCGLGVAGYQDCELDFYPWPYGACIGRVCLVYYTGTNELTTLYLGNNPPQNEPRRWGILMADFPGAGLIEAIIDANDANLKVVYLPVIYKN